VIARGWLTQARPAPFLVIADANPLQRQVKEWIHGNCAHCHNGEPVLEPGARYPQLDLRWDKFMAGYHRQADHDRGDGGGHPDRSRPAQPEHPVPRRRGGR
jgi:hypothetical protein